MDKIKCTQLKEIIKARGYEVGGKRVLIPRSEFFDGNDDLGSIGCNLPNHPGVAAFDAVFRRIEEMDGVERVYFAITEIDETHDTIWPFTDTVWIVTRNEASAFESILSSLEPDGIAISQEEFANPPTIPEGYRMVYVWWD